MDVLSSDVSHGHLKTVYQVGPGRSFSVWFGSSVYGAPERRVMGHGPDESRATPTVPRPSPRAAVRTATRTRARAGPRRGRRTSSSAAGGATSSTTTS